ncbi:unnamed protein product [Urochloa humidicola]
MSSVFGGGWLSAVSQGRGSTLSPRVAAGAGSSDEPKTSPPPRTAPPCQPRPDTYTSPTVPRRALTNAPTATTTKRARHLPAPHSLAKLQDPRSSSHWLIGVRLRCRLAVGGVADTSAYSTPCVRAV